MDSTFFGQLYDARSYLKDLKSQLPSENFRSLLLDLKMARIVANCDRRYLAPSAIFQAASRLQCFPKLLYGINSYIRPHYSLECLTKVSQVKHYVLVEGNRSRIYSFVNTTAKAPSTDVDFRPLIRSRERWSQILEDNPDEEWRACLAQVIVEILKDDSTDSLTHSAARKCLMRLGNQGVVPCSNFVHFPVHPSRSYADRAEYIASGGGCDVYRLDTGNGTICLRVLRRRIAANNKDKLYRDACVELNIWRQLNHPNVIECFGASLDIFPGRICFILPWLNHGSIISFLKKYPNHDRFSSVCQIVDAVEYLHGLDPPIFHKDIKGANILMRSNMVCVLTDLGLSRMLDSQRSKTSGGKGTYRWMAPEHFHSTLLCAEAGPQDMYALGCTIYEIYTGGPPFASLADVARGRHLPIPPKGNWTWEEEELWGYVEVCLFFEPGHRPTIEKFKMALEADPRWRSCHLPLSGI